MTDTGEILCTTVHVQACCLTLLSHSRTRRWKASGNCARRNFVARPPMECDTMFTRAPLFAALMDSSFSSSAFECDRLLCLQDMAIPSCVNLCSESLAR